MERMARDTKQPQVLRELFEALGNDPAVIAECLARPILAQRLIAGLSAQEQTRWFDSTRTDNLRAMSVTTRLGQFAYTLPEIANAGDPPCADDTWMATTTANAPTDRCRHTAVWTGTEMIVWGGADDHLNLLNTGGTYNPSTDSWTATSTTNAAAGREYYTAVWTGTEMIVWGGLFVGVTGGRYCATPPLRPPNDAFASAILLTGANGMVTGSNVNATREAGEPAGENTVWYMWTAPNNGEATFLIGMDWLTIDVFTGTAINALTRVATSSGSPSAVTWTTVQGTTYRIRLSKNTRTSSFRLLWSL